MAVTRTWSEMEALAAGSRRRLVEYTMAAKEEVIAEQPAAHAVFHEAVTEEGMQCPATWAIYADAEGKDNLGLGPTEDEAWDAAVERLAKRAAALATAAEPGEDVQAAEIREYLHGIYDT